MRLINIHTLHMQDFPGANRPRYAILSHRWYSAAEEVSYEDFMQGQGHDRAGYRKIIDFCRFLKASANHSWAHFPRPPETGEGVPRSRKHWVTDISTLEAIHWIWIDTCCIDKRSSAELSEAITSMYQYYQDAEICVVYLSDVDESPCGAELCESGCSTCHKAQRQLQCSEWFKRGWTLQELVAPLQIMFVTATWNSMGCIYDWYKYSSKSNGRLLDTVANASGIPSATLSNTYSLHEASIAQRLSWAANRKTTRTEDRAYSLFGLLGVRLPLLYGEGDRAWLRLQQEIVRSSSDESIFAWNLDSSRYISGMLSAQSVSPQPALAPKLDFFATCSRLQCTPRFERQPYTITNQGLELKLRPGTAYLTFAQRGRIVLIPLNCGMTSGNLECDPEARMLILQRRPGCGHYERLDCMEAQAVPKLLEKLAHKPDWVPCDEETIYVHTTADACQPVAGRTHITTGIRARPHMSSVFERITGAGHIDREDSQLAIETRTLCLLDD